MQVDEEYLIKLIENPTESLNVELKNWLNLETPEGISKIAKACMAMWNNDGGILVIGINDDGTSDVKNAPPNVKGVFSSDIIQGIVSKYAAYPLEVNVKYVAHKGQIFPAIIMKSGTKCLLASKSDLKVGEVYHIREHTVYVRTLVANNKASTAAIKHSDYDRLIKICLDNREAEIARFLRRHFTEENIDSLAAFLNSDTRVNRMVAVEKENVLDKGEKIFLAATSTLNLPPHGSFEAGFCVDGSRRETIANSSFYNLITSSNPRLTGWPFWVDAKPFYDVNNRPIQTNNGWQASIVTLENTVYDKIDFWRMEPLGLFYHRRGIEDDVGAKAYLIKPFATLEWTLAITRVGEVIATGIAFSKAMCEGQPTSHVRFYFRWKRLKGRILANWASRNRDILTYCPAIDDEVYTTIIVPIETPNSSMFIYVHKVTKVLFSIFGGMEISPSIVEDVLQKKLFVD